MKMLVQIVRRRDSFFFRFPPFCPDGSHLIWRGAHKEEGGIYDPPPSPQQLSTEKSVKEEVTFSFAEKEGFEGVHCLFPPAYMMRKEGLLRERERERGEREREREKERGKERERERERKREGKKKRERGKERERERKRERERERKKDRERERKDKELFVFAPNTDGGKRKKKERICFE